MLSFFKGNCSVGIHSSISTTVICNRKCVKSQQINQQPNSWCDLTRKIERVNRLPAARKSTSGALKYEQFFSSKQSNEDLLYFDKYQEGLFLSILNWFSKVLDCQKNRLQIEPEIKVIHPKYSKHCLSTIAHTIDCVGSKILNHGLNHGLLFSLFKFFGWKIF